MLMCAHWRANGKIEGRERENGLKEERRCLLDGALKKKKNTQESGSLVETYQAGTTTCFLSFLFVLPVALGDG
jgi:hypothetical protein